MLRRMPAAAEAEVPEDQAGVDEAREDRARARARVPG
jgi:hypothetical protein